MFIVRMVFWVSFVALLLPSAPNGAAADAGPAIEGEDAVTMAMSTGADVMGFCTRNAAVCDFAGETGRHILDQVSYYGVRAAEWAYDAAEAAVSAAPNTAALLAGERAV